ncbi:DUF58 domain-containing protein [Bacillus solitudinis]|uniref:DUF58 domain-containing protein n=1 Tax=Bacillus solitudinis TaxID=2014074 RepID=UPI000C244697|nr:DUF58 domain-containing protein [Bacillus solitudinis]
MNIAWFIIVTFLIIGVQTFVYTKWGLKRIQYQRSFSEKFVFEGDSIEMVDEVANLKFLPMPWLRLESKIDASLKFRKQSDTDNDVDGNDFHRTLFSLLPYQKITRKQYVTCEKRGFYRFEAVSLSTGDVFGFSSTFRQIPSTAEVIVYPKIVSMKELPLPAHSWLGDITVRRWIIEDPFLHSGVREYANGDSMNTVNWKATARTSRLQVTKKDFSADHHLMIYLNFNQSEDHWLPITDIALMEKGISYAASVANYAIEQGISTGFACNSYLDKQEKEAIRIEPEQSKQQLTFILETLAKVKLDTSKSFNYFLKEDIENKLKGTDVLLITAVVTESMRASIKRLEAQGNAIKILMLKQGEIVREEVSAR